MICDLINDNFFLMLLLLLVVLDYIMVSLELWLWLVSRFVFPTYGTVKASDSQVDHD